MIKLIFWIGVIATLVYFSGDLKYKDRSLKSWVLGLIGSDTAQTLGTGSSLVKEVDRLLKSGSDSLSDTQIKQVEKLIDERLSKGDRASLEKLMQDLASTPPKNSAGAKKATSDNAKKAEPAKITSPK